MDIKILDSWLREFLATPAKPAEVAKYLSLCGPSVERVQKVDSGRPGLAGTDVIYNIEVTTNRIDTASVYGIARESAAILPRFGVKAKLNTLYFDKGPSFVKKVNYLEAAVDPNLCSRFCTVLIKNVKIGQSSELVKTRLESAGVRAINNVVDISNYIMLELGQPVHTFDYDKIKGAKMILRESKKGEKITTLDGKEFKLNGGDIVIEDGDNRLIDLAGVMGGNLSAVDENTKNVLLFVQTYDPVRIRKTSMSLAQRTMAATIFEKGTDTELVTPAILKGIEMFKTLCKGIAEKEILDIYPHPYKPTVKRSGLLTIQKKLGILISKNEITNYLTALGFGVKWNDQALEVLVPSFRSQDVLESEDIVEEVARIYGYHNLPSKLMTGKLTGRSSSTQFVFEEKVKSYLAGWGGAEVYTLSLVSKEMVDQSALKLKNPLGTDSEYLRTSLMPSLISAANENVGTIDQFHLFEMANIYLPRNNNLPEELLMLTGIFEGCKYRLAKGIVESLLEKLKLKVFFEPSEEKGFAAGSCVSILVNKEEIGCFGYIENSELIYYEFEMRRLYEFSPKNTPYKQISKYPPQIEDITLTFPEKTYIGAVTDLISNIDYRVSNIFLKDIFKEAYTFRIEYQDPKKTLTDKEVEEIRNKVLAKVKDKFGGQIKN